ncbi:MAG: hypothetical protein HYR98_05920 [Nitrospirae bacterium]|nr:hypothetical protein [Nitrospirota bacterium]MBI3392005.1 hypothetical protein [Nitrospirota bacterium]
MTVLTERDLHCAYSHVVSTDAVRDTERLLEIVVGPGGETSVVRMKPEREGPRSILEIEGLGKDVWEGIDAKKYIDELRNEWDAR